MPRRLELLARVTPSALGTAQLLAHLLEVVLERLQLFLQSCLAQLRGTSLIGMLDELLTQTLLDHPLKLKLEGALRLGIRLRLRQVRLWVRLWIRLWVRLLVRHRLNLLGFLRRRRLLALRHGFQGGVHHRT